VAEELGDGDEVGSASYEVGAEGVAQDVRGDEVAEGGCGGDTGDDLVGAAGGQAGSGAVEARSRCQLLTEPLAPMCV
jgi:hypothetical protein